MATSPNSKVANALRTSKSEVDLSAKFILRTSQSTPDFKIFILRTSQSTPDSKSEVSWESNPRQLGPEASMLTIVLCCPSPNHPEVDFKFQLRTPDF